MEGYRRLAAALLNKLKYILPGILLILLVLLEIYSYSAAYFFNRAMEQQDMLHGEITVETITAHINGHVYFENLQWKNPEGKMILSVPRGDFRVNLLDVLLQNYKSTTIRELNLEDVEISIHLNDDMSWDLVRHSPALERMPKQMDPDSEWEKKVKLAGKSEEELRAIGERRRRIQQERLEKQWKNFDRDGRKLNLKLSLNKCRLEIFYKARHYLMSNMNFRADIDTDNEMTLQASAGRFGGTMHGYGMKLKGSMDFSDGEVPTARLTLSFRDIDPSSLGFGMDLKDPISLITYLEGPISHPVGSGSISMKQLRLPNLEFQNVKGDIFYEDAMLRFSDVKANVYEGDLIANGYYNLDTRYYHIEGHGERLKAKAALPKDSLRCDVVLDLTVDSKGSPKNTTYRGRFKSGPGLYSWVTFESLAGKFRFLDKKLDFYDIRVDLGGILATTDTLTVDHGKIALHPIHIWDENGKPYLLFDPEKKELVRDISPDQ